MMVTRLGLRAPRLSRNFMQSARNMAAHENPYGHPATGVYSNLPFKVKGTKIPFGFKWWGVFGFFFSFPFLTSYVHMKRAGNI